jgi:choice-of-anchor C domain-containing protein
MDRAFHSRVSAAALMIGSVFCAPYAGAASLIVNGGFETGPNVTDTMQIPGGSTAITGWMVSPSNIDYRGNYWVPAEGGRSLALNGSAPGGISQVFATDATAIYTVYFCLSGDPFSAPAIVQMRVSAAGQSADFSFDTTPVWSWSMDWVEKSWSFTANSSSTTLEFTSLSTGYNGPALDSVSVELTTPPAGVDDLTVADFSLALIAPNPTQGDGHVEFTVPRTSAVRIDVLDVAGRRVASLANATYEPGQYHLTWDGRDASGARRTGLYFVSMRAEGRTFVRRLVVEG